MPHGNVYTRSVVRAIEVVGGPARLAEILDVPASQVSLWATGGVAPSIEMLIQIFDIVAQGPYYPKAVPKERRDDAMDPDF